MSSSPTTASLVARLLGLAVAAALLVPAAVAQGAPGGPKCDAAKGQALIDQGRLEQAVREFTCLVEAQPTEVEGYRGRIEAQLLLGRYSDAFADFARVTAFVVPAHPDAVATLLSGYAARLDVAPNDIPALTGASFIRWCDFQYPQAINVLEGLLEVRPDDLYATLFRGSSRVLKGVNKTRGLAELERAIALAPTSPDVRFIAADAFTYGAGELERAFVEATLALEGGLDTPRVHAILGAALNAFGDTEAAAAHIHRHIELATTELVAGPELGVGDALELELVPGRAYAIPVPVTAGETISVATRSHDYWDSIAVLLAPDGTPVVGSDDDAGYHVAFDWVAEETGTYVLQVMFFEAVNTGVLVVTRS